MFAMDACMLRARGMAGDQVFSIAFPKEVKKDAHITHLGLWAVIISVKTWGSTFRGKIVEIKTDNQAVAQIINTGHSQDLKLQELLRELIWWLAKWECRVKGVHLPGKINRIPDLLSRWHQGPEIHHEFEELTQHRNIEWCDATDKVFKLAHTW